MFVDTPGLHDPVKYRSNITREYIAHANAVLVAVKLGALTEEPLETITTVLDYAGNNRDKVFIVGTQKDVLNEANDYDQLVNGKGGWVDQLTQTRYFEDRDTVSLHMSSIIKVPKHKGLPIGGEVPSEVQLSPYVTLKQHI